MKKLTNIIGMMAAYVFTLGLPNNGRAADANPPERMTYQGYLVDGNGDPLGNSAPSNYDVIFRIYDAKQGGAKLWTEQQTVTVDKGYFSALLGEGTSFNNEPNGNLSSVFGGLSISDRFIGITVDMNGSSLEIAPRLRLLSSPYSFTATQARRLTDSAGNPNFYKEGNALKIGAGSSPSMTLTDDGYLGLGVDNTDHKLAVKTTDTLKPYPLSLQGPHGNVFMGAGNTSYFHFITDRPSFNFNKPISTAGSVKAWTSGRPGVLLGGSHSNGNLVDNIVEGLDANGNPGALYLNYYSDSLVHVGYGGGGLQTPYANVTGNTPSHFSGPIKLWRSGRPGVSLGGGNAAGSNVDNVIEGLGTDGNYSALNLNYYSTEPVYLGKGGGGAVIYGKTYSLGWSSWPKSLYVTDENETHGAISGPGGTAIGFHANRHIYFIDILEKHYTASLSEKGVWWSLSDLRLKKDVEVLVGTLDKLESIRGVKYKYKKQKDESAVIGVIAQDLEKHFPELIETMPNLDPDSKEEPYMAVNYNGLGPVLIEAVKELRAEKDEQLARKDKRINELENRLARLEELVGKIDQ